jgi:hypothetical protein
MGQILADVPSGLSLTPPQETIKKKTSSLVEIGHTPAASLAGGCSERRHTAN